MFVYLALGLGGLVLLTVAADHLVRGSSRLARHLRISPVVVGVVVIGLGTSAPEFLVSGLAAARGDTGIAMGNLVGSNIINLTLVLGVAGLIAPVAVRSSVIAREVPLAVIAVTLLATFAAYGVDAWLGMVLLILLAGAVLMLIRWARAGTEPELETDVAGFTSNGHRLWPQALRALLGLAGVLIGAQVMVVNASAIATEAGVPPVIIGFTVVALGTSLPELVTCIQAQRRGETALAVGNLFGSNLFNSLAGGGLVGLAAGSQRATLSPLLLAPMVVAAIVAWYLLRRGLSLNRREGLALLGLYAVTLPLLLTQ